MDSFLRSGILVFGLIIFSFILFKGIDIAYPEFENKWYFGLGLIFGVLGVLIVQDRFKKYEEDEIRNGD